LTQTVNVIYPTSSVSQNMKVSFVYISSPRRVCRPLPFNISPSWVEGWVELQLYVQPVTKAVYRSGLQQRENYANCLQWDSILRSRTPNFVDVAMGCSCTHQGLGQHTSKFDQFAGLAFFFHKHCE